jgi:hypothetical protein
MMYSMEISTESKTNKKQQEISYSTRQHDKDTVQQETATADKLHKKHNCM